MARTLIKNARLVSDGHTLDGDLLMEGARIESAMPLWPHEDVAGQLGRVQGSSADACRGLG